MSEPSPAWPVAPQTQIQPQPLAAPAPPHLAVVADAPPHPPVAMAAPVLVQPAFAPAPSFASPADPAAALDVAAPLAPPPGYAPSGAMPDLDVAPAEPEVLEGPATSAFSMAAAASPAMPTLEVAPDPTADGDAAADGSAAAAPRVDPNGEWWSPVNALVLGMFALMLQLVSFYAREQLPPREVSGAVLDRFDTIVGNLPLVGSAVGGILALFVAAGSVAVLLVGIRRGVREPVLQGAAGGVAAVAVLCTGLLGALIGG